MGGRPLRFVHFPDPNRVRPWMQRMARERERETGRKRRIERQGREWRGRRGRRREGGRRGRDVCAGGKEVERGVPGNEGGGDSAARGLGLLRASGGGGSKRMCAWTGGGMREIWRGEMEGDGEGEMEMRDDERQRHVKC